MDLIRSFLAVPPDAALRERLVRLFPGCAGEVGGPEEPARLRWAAARGLHVTLVFLGATRVDQIASLRDMVTGIAPRLRAFCYALRGPVVFPDTRKPRVLALEPDDPQPFSQWQAPLAAGCAALGFPREARAYRPHLSLARLRGLPVESLTPAVGALTGSASEIALYESRDGVYEPLFRVPCGEVARA